MQWVPLAFSPLRPAGCVVVPEKEERWRWHRASGWRTSTLAETERRKKRGTNLWDEMKNQTLLWRLIIGSVSRNEFLSPNKLFEIYIQDMKRCNCSHSNRSPTLVCKQSKHMRPALMMCRTESVLVPYRFFSYSPDSINFPPAKSVSKEDRLTKWYSHPFRSCILGLLVVSVSWKRQETFIFALLKK